MAIPPDVTERLLSWGPLQRALNWGPAEPVLTWARIDFSPPHRQPRWPRLALATVLAVVLSLVADAALVAMGTRVFPATKGFVHFRFFDYAALTVVGVLIACAGWPIVTRVCAAPRWLFFRLAIVVTLVLFLPDVYIWLKGESGQAVAVLMAMHVAIALITYNLLVHVAPVRPLRVRRAAHAVRAARVGQGGRQADVPSTRPAARPATRVGSPASPAPSASPVPSQSPLSSESPVRPLPIAPSESTAPSGSGSVRRISAR